MLVISYGLPKSASTFVFQLTKLLVEQAGHNQSAVRQKYLEPALRTEFIHLTPQITDALLKAVPEDEILIVKTHAALAGQGEQAGDPRIKATVSTRDPREAILSAIETGARERRDPGGRQAFAQFRTARNTLPMYKRHCANALEWLQRPGILHVTYKDIHDRPVAVGQSIVDYLGIQASAERAASWLTEKKTARITEFSVGKMGRYTEKFTPEENALLERELAVYIDAFR